MPEAPGEGGQGGPGEGGVADIGELFHRQFREQADGYGVDQVKGLAEAAADDDPFQVVHGEAHALQEGLVAGIHGPLGPDKVFHVDFRQDQVPVQAGFGLGLQKVFPAVFALPDQVGGGFGHELALGVQHPGQKEFGRDGDEAGTADAQGLGLWFADDRQPVAAEGRVEIELVHGPGRGPHAELDPAALKGRAGRTGGAGHPVLVADHYLPVGAHVYEEGQFRALIHARGQHPGHDIAAHIAGDGRIDQQRGRGGNFQTHLGGPEYGPVGRGRHIGGQADVFGVQAGEEVAHGGIAGHHHQGQAFAVRLMVGQEVFQEAVDVFRNPVLQAGQAVAPAGEDDAADDILPEGDLAVQIAPAGAALAVGQVDQAGPDRGGAYIHGQGQGRPRVRARENG